MSGPAEQQQSRETRSLRRWQRRAARLLRAFARLELVFDRIFWGLRRRYGRLGPLQVVTYRGYGTATLGTEMVWVAHATQALEHARVRGFAR